MDLWIEALKSPVSFGCRLTRRQITEIRKTVAMCPAPIRNESAKIV